jgi:hypothetical protein
MRRLRAASCSASASTPGGNSTHSTKPPRGADTRVPSGNCVAILLFAVGCSSTPRAPKAPATLPAWTIEISTAIERSAETDPHQQSSDLDALYAEAQVAFAELQTTTQRIASNNNGRAVIPPSLKGRARAMEKIEADYKGDASRLFDICRSTIEYGSIVDLYHGLEAIAHQLKIIRLKDRFARPLENGYRDILMNVRMANRHICEIQLHLKQIRAVKEDEHKRYEVTRSIEATAKREQRELTADEKATIAKVIAQAKQAYDAAFEAALKP